MTARGRIERGNANQAVHTAFGGEKPESVFALDPHRRGFEPRAFTGRQVNYSCAESLALRPAEIHAQQHFGPVLRLRAAGSGLDGHDGVQAVVLPGEQSERLQFRDKGVGRGDFALDFVEQGFALGHVGLFFGKTKIRFDVAQRAFELFVRSDNLFRGFALLQDSLRLFLVLPEIRL